MRILIASVTAGAGHLQAAAALEEAWTAFRPGDLLEKLDVLDFAPRWYRNIYTNSYVKVVEHAPELWGMVFNKTDDPKLAAKLSRMRQGMAGLTNSRFVKRLAKFRPDAVLCTHYLPLEILASFKAERAASQHPVTVSIVTDFEAHALWMEPCVDLYCVATEETKARLVARGAPPENVVATGIPIGSRFARPIDPGVVRRRMGLRDDLPVVLVLSGGFGMGPVEEILIELNKLEELIQVVVVCGKNEELRHRLAVADYRHPTRTLGFVSNMEEWMGVSDLIITKPGGLTTSEALAMGKPLFILNPIPGQEAANSDFLLAHMAAAKANRVEDLPYRLGQLLSSQKLVEMAAAAKSLGRPDAAMEVCRRVAERLEGRPLGPPPRRSRANKTHIALPRSRLAK